MAAPTTRSRTRQANKDADEAKTETTEGETPTEETPQAEGEQTEAKNGEATAEDAEKAKEESERERKAREKAEAEQKARQAKIDAGDLIVLDGVEFEASSKETKVSGQVQDIIGKYEDDGTETPLVFADVVKGIDAKYPEDLIPAMHALEHLGIVRRFDARNTKDEAGNRRRQTAYLWLGLENAGTPVDDEEATEA